MSRNSAKSTFPSLGRLLIAAVVLILLVVAGVVIHNALQPKPLASGEGEGVMSLPTLNGLTADTYKQIDSHPELYQGDEIKWPCKVVGFLGTDSGGNTGIDCTIYNPTDTLQKSDGAVIILASPDIDVSNVRTGDDITLDGYVDEPYTGKNAQGEKFSWPQISASVITDHGPP